MPDEPNSEIAVAVGEHTAHIENLQGDLAEVEQIAEQAKETVSWTLDQQMAAESRITSLEQTNQDLNYRVEDLESRLSSLAERAEEPAAEAEAEVTAPVEEVEVEGAPVVETPKNRKRHWLWG